METSIQELLNLVDMVLPVWEDCESHLTLEPEELTEEDKDKLAVLKYIYDCFDDSIASRIRYHEKRGIVLEDDLDKIIEKYQ